MTIPSSHQKMVNIKIVFIALEETIIIISLGKREKQQLFAHHAMGLS